MSLSADMGSFKVFLEGVNSKFKGSVHPKMKNQSLSTKHFWSFWAKQLGGVLMHAHAFSLAASVKLSALKRELIMCFFKSL